MEEFVIVPRKCFASKPIKAMSAEEALIDFATTMDTDMNLYFKAVSAEKVELTELVHNKNGSVYRLGNIPPAMFEFFLHKKRTYKDGTSQWNIGVSPSEAYDKGYVFSSIRGSEDDAKKEFEHILFKYALESLSL